MHPELKSSLPDEVLTNLKNSQLGNDINHLVQNISYSFLNSSLVNKYQKVSGFNDVTVQDDSEKRINMQGKPKQSLIHFQGVSCSQDKRVCYMFIRCDYLPYI